MEGEEGGGDAGEGCRVLLGGTGRSKVAGCCHEWRNNEEFGGEREEEC